MAICYFDYKILIKIQQLLKFIKLTSDKLNKFYIIINLFLYIMIIEYQ